MTSEMQAIESTLSELLAADTEFNIEADLAKMMNTTVADMKWEELPEKLRNYLAKMSALQFHPIMMLLPSMQDTSFLHAMLIGWRAHEQFTAAKELERMMEETT